MIFDIYDVAVVILAKDEERVSRPMRVRDLKKKKINRKKNILTGKKGIFQFGENNKKMA